GTSRITKLGGRSFQPEELSALVLKSLKADAEAFAGEDVRDVVISVPAYFNEPQRRATQNAGRLAGLNVLRIVNEPTAAALAYGFGSADEGKYVIFDLGGGTFDVSILDKYEGVMEVRATAGDTTLGGNNFTEAVMALMAGRHQLYVPELKPVERAVLLREAERVKTALTKADEQEFVVELASGTRKGVISRREFQEACTDLLRRLRAPLERAVHDARMTPESFDAVILAGGATRMPMVRSLVAQLFRRLPLVHIDPDTVVALGAAVQAGLCERNAALEDVVMTDVCPHSLGTAFLDEGTGSDYVHTVIPRNAVVPVSRSAFGSTVQNNQTDIRIRVFQGEFLRPEDDIHIGDVSIRVPPRPKGQEVVEIRYTYDVSGALEVEVRSRSTGKMERAVFLNRQGLSEDELKKRFDSLADLKLHPRERLNVKNVMTRAERLYSEHTGHAREQVLALLSQFTAAVNSQELSPKELDRKCAEFHGMLDDFEIKVF
ncbi:MAG: Hsp70 family protein, partial [Methylobacteriaceae bacterium]|nr:Hsp70 family protein [Methylobacteriaceae bacterium]